MSLTIYLTPQDVERRLDKLGIPCRFDDEEREKLATMPVVRSEARVFCFPTPAVAVGLTISKIKAAVGSDSEHQPCIFDHPWYRDEPFVTVPCSPGWHCLTMDILPDSILKPVNYLDSSGSLGPALPSAIEVLLMLFLHYEASKEQLLLKKHTWCSDVASQDRHVTVGAFGRNGVFISGHPRNFVSQGLGVCGRLSG